MSGTSESSNPTIWTPDDDRVQRSAMHDFMQANDCTDYSSLHAWSLREPEKFWPAVADYCDLRFSQPATRVLEQTGDMQSAKWFSGSTINYAEHLLRHDGDREALIFRGERGERQSISVTELRKQVAAVACGLRQAGVGRGDRVAGFLPNCPETVVAMLATTSIGAVWSSCSPDFGVNGIVDRFGQIAPRVLFCANGYFYNGKRFDCLAAVAEVSKRVASIKRAVVVPFTSDGTKLPDDERYVSWQRFSAETEPLSFAALPFDHPLFIMYSSGTTGAPKCIVHGHGGTLIQHQKEQVLHCDLRADDRLFYFTTCGWMMWNWLVSGLASGSTLVLFDGAPFYDDGRILWQIADEENVTIFGTSAKYIAAQEKAGRRPAKEFDLSSLKTVLSTGSPLAPASFDYVYEEIGRDLQLSSIAGGTDIISCFAIGNPCLPVRRGELQCLGLGMAVEIYNDAGKPVVGENGELVCTQPFPSMPTGFWHDDDGSRYRAAYFERFPGVWAHGDYAEITPAGGMIIKGRSDAVLNPGGVRIGTAEIYRQVEKLDDVLESIVIGQQWDDDVRVVLFVVLRAGVSLDDKLCKRIRAVIRENATPRHVPAKILQVDAIPRTISGKIVELAVRSVVHGETVRNTDALANPEALEHFRNRPELEV